MRKGVNELCNMIAEQILRLEFMPRLIIPSISDKLLYEKLWK